MIGAYAARRFVLRSWSEATVESPRHSQVFDVAVTPDGFLATGPSGEPSCLGGIWASSAGRAWKCVASDPHADNSGGLPLSLGSFWLWGADAYITDDGLTVSMVSTFDGAELKFKP